MLDVNNVSFDYGRNPVLNDITFHMEQGEFVSVLGANGCGKTTLMRTIMGFLKPNTGEILFEGEDTQKMSPRDLAKRIAYIPQAHTPPFAFTVWDVVLMGRTPHLKSNSRPTSEDKEIAREAIASLGLSSMAERVYTHLSGGQRQLVIIARALAQQPALLIMDEPTSSLDYGNQYLVLEHVRNLAHKGMAVLMVTHDPAHAVFCADRIVAIKNGRIVNAGDVASVISEPVMTNIYNMDIKVRNVELNADEECVVCIPRPAKEERS